MTRWVCCLLGCLVIAIIGCKQSGEVSSSGSATSATGTSSGATTTDAGGSSAAVTSGGGNEVTLPNGLRYQDLKVGDGALAETGKTISVHYTGTLPNGTQFDSSVGGSPYTLKLGAGTVIKGWDEGIKGMRVGGKRKLTIPPDMAYGATGYPPVIPPNSTLLFDVELMEVR